MRIAFRADASPTIGSGHVMRCLALAHELRARGDEICFFSHGMPDRLATLARAGGFSLAPAELGGGPWDWLVVDHYQLGAEWERGQRGAVHRVMVIDDLANRAHDCDLLLDQNVIGAANPYAGLVPPHCRVYLGPGYALLRSAFAGGGKRATGLIRRVFVCFGGSDPMNHTAAALRALEPHAARLDRIDVVSPSDGEVEELCQRIPNVRLQVGGEVADLLRAADLAIGGGGSMAWERACLGVPTLAFGIAENQLPVLERLFEAGCAVGETFMPHPDQTRMAAWLSAVLENAPLLRGIGARSAELVDGRGSQRIADALHSAGISFRRATKADSEDMLRWRNHPEVRARSLDANEIDPKTHSAWMDRVLADPDRELLVAEDAGRPVGVVRFDLQGVGATISVYRTPDPMQGSRGLIRQATDWLRQNHPEVATVTAEILADNAASVAAFRKAGYSDWKHLLQCKLK